MFFVPVKFVRFFSREINVEKVQELLAEGDLLQHENGRLHVAYAYYYCCDEFVEDCY